MFCTVSYDSALDFPTLEAFSGYSLARCFFFGYLTRVFRAGFIYDFGVLATFDVTGNKITKLQQALGKLVSLTSLSFADNLLDELPLELGLLTKLQHLSWRGNRLRVPPEICDGVFSVCTPTPSTLNPQPSTLNPQPSTLHPQPPTLHLQTCRCALRQRTRGGRTGPSSTLKGRPVIPISFSVPLSSLSLFLLLSLSPLSLTIVEYPRP